MACVAAPPLDWDALLREVARRRALIERFRRTMRRHERRARRMGLPATAEHIRDLRLDPHPDHARDVAALAVIMRGSGGDDSRRIGFALSLAAAACARHRADMGASQ